MIPNAMRRALVTALKAASGPLDGALVKLYQNDYLPTTETVLTDLTEADFTGYSAGAAATWGGVGTDALDKAYTQTQRYEFASSGATTTNTIYGFFVTNGAGTTLIDAVRFDEPVPMNDVGDICSVVYRFLLPDDGGVDALTLP